MAQIPLEIRPGINKELTPTANKAGWTDGDKVRFFQGLPQAIGGWVDRTSSTFPGICRGLHVWVDLSSNINIAIGTHNRLMLERGGALFDITPLRREVVISNPVSTSAGSSVITIVDNSHQAVTGDYLVISNSDPVGGLSIDGLYTLTVLSNNSYRITVSGTASATTTGGGAQMTLGYYISTGKIDGAPDSGYGTGGYGTGSYGTPRAAGIVRDPRTWSLDNWGEDLIASYTGGPVYLWSAANGTGTRARLIPEAPSACEGVIVSQPDRHLITYGSSLNSDQDFLNINFSDRENYTIWNALDTNQAGAIRIPGGSRLMVIVRTRGELLALSDTDASAVRFVGSPYVFGVFSMGSNCGAISKKCAVDVQGMVFWMGIDNFFIYNGRVTILPCPMRDFVFNNLNLSARSKVFAVYIKEFSEVWFFYADSTSTEINRYISVSVLDPAVWGCGSLVRTAGHDGGAIGYPIMTGTDGRLYVHESGTTAAGSTIASFLDSADFRYGEGDKFFFTDKIIPDFQNLDSNGVNITMKWRRYPNEAQSSKGPYHISTTTTWINTRVRSKQQSVRVDSNGPWRMGRLTFNIQPDGER